MRKLHAFIVSCLILQTSPLIAAHDMQTHEHKHGDAVIANKPMQHIDTVDKNVVIFEVHGIVCSFCSAGVRKKLSKLPFVDKSKYNGGVLVEIESQKVTMAILPNKKPDFKAAFEAIKSGGYDPVKAIFTGDDGSITTKNPQ